MSRICKNYHKLQLCGWDVGVVCSVIGCCDWL